MNIKVINAFLGFVAILLGVSMLVCTIWGFPGLGGGPEEGPGCTALYYSSLISFVVGGAFTLFGRGYDSERIYLREAFACVALCWILAILLGALPYLLAHVQRTEGVPFTIGDAIFESASGITTTGGSVFSELEDPQTLPRTIMFWRCLTHFLGGLGVMCCFVVFLGKGASGKAVLKVEHIFSGNLPFAKMRSLARSLCAIYLVIFFACCAWFLTCGMTFYDALTHAFSVVSLGGFSTHNDSAGYFAHQGNVHHVALEYGMIFFMIVSGINYWLLFWASRGAFSKVFKDSECRFYLVSISFVTILTLCLGLYQGSFILKKTVVSQQPPAKTVRPDVLVVAEEDPVWFEEIAVPEIICDKEELHESARCTNCSVVCNTVEDAFRKSLFHTVSLMTSMGFATDRYECWSGSTILLFMLIMFMGGCSGSPAGGIKVNRALMALRLLRNEPERHYRPNVVRATKYGTIIGDTNTALDALKYAGYFAGLIVVTTVFVSAIEPDTMWLSHDRPQIEKLFDIFGASLAMFGNTGLAFGEFGSAGNYSSLTDVSKIVFSWAMVVGRLEIWCVLALFSRRFWKNR